MAGWLKKKEEQMRSAYGQIGQGYLALGYADGKLQKQIAAREALQEFMAEESEIAIAGFDFEWDDEAASYGLEDDNPSQEDSE